MTPVSRPPSLPSLCPLEACADQITGDQRTIANRLAAAPAQNDDSSRKDLSKEGRASQKDPTLPAKLHGNEPSRGAAIDKEIADEEAEIIARKDAKK
ncbi:hypothetical protein DV736_g4395, partial [Chaetothyriales sp. CBS 134916]